MNGLIAYVLSKKKAKTYTDTKFDSISGGFDYKGSVATVEDLPATATKGDEYTVGNLGTYVWDGTAWKPAGIKGTKGDPGQKGDKGDPGSNTVSVSATGTSTNDVRYITIDGTESRFTSVALRAMKSAWVTGTTQAAATAILNDDSVVAGDGFLATVYWSDLPGDLTQAEVKAFVMKKSGSYQKIIQFECTSGTVAPYSWFYNSYERVWRSQVPLNDTVTSTSTNEALTANMGKSLQDQISNLQNIGRFLSIWNCTTGKPETNPTVMPYTYRTGDYYRVGTIAAEGGTNYKPDGSSYNNVASTVAETETVAIGAVYYYDGSVWRMQAAGGGGTVQDVQINGTSIINAETGVANITDATTSSSGTMSATDKTKLNGVEAGADVTDAANVAEAGAVMVTAQSLTDAQKAQAVHNIGLATQDTIPASQWSTYSGTADLVFLYE